MNFNVAHGAYYKIRLARKTTVKSKVGSEANYVDIVEANIFLGSTTTSPWPIEQKPYKGLISNTKCVYSALSPIALLLKVAYCMLQRIKYLLKHNTKHSLAKSK